MAPYLAFVSENSSAFCFEAFLSMNVAFSLCDVNTLNEICADFCRTCKLQVSLSNK